MKKAAEMKKADKRKTILKMREELQQLMQENEDQTPERRIEPSEFVIDQEYSALLEKKGLALQKVGIACCSRLLLPHPCSACSA